MAVITALELNDKGAPCEAACEANRRHAGFRSRADETQLLYRGKALLNELREIGFSRGTCAKRGAQPSGLANSCHRRWERMAEQHGPPGAEEIDIAIAVCVREVRTLGAGNKGGITADGAKRTNWRIHTPRK